MSEQITAYFNNIATGVKSFITGLSLTFKHFKNKKEHVATLQYPHEKFPVPEKKIGFEQSEYNVIRSRLHVDIDDCISCRMCERACPVDCIKIEDVKAKKGVEFEYGQTSNDTQKKLLVTRFTIDMSECMYCNLCVYPCPEECIYMVGGPNESKHEIDYEFSQYKREGMIFEFAKAETEDLVKMGADDYLKKIKEKEENIIKGERLLGLESDIIPEPVAAAPVAAAPAAAPAAATPVSGTDNLTIKCVDIIEDIKLRAAAKKVFFKSKKAGEDDITKVDKMIAELKTVDGFSADLEQKLNALKPEPVAAEMVATNTSTATASQASQPEVEQGLFDIKILNEIEDIATRANLKKIYMGAKKSSKNSPETISEMIGDLESKGLITDQVKSLLEGILK